MSDLEEILMFEDRICFEHEVMLEWNSDRTELICPICESKK